MMSDVHSANEDRDIHSFVIWYKNLVSLFSSEKVEQEEQLSI